MAQAQRLKMGLARSSSKTRERELIKLAKRLAKNPMIVLPECTPECEKDPFARIVKQLTRVKDAADDEELLKRLSKRGDNLARAVAGTILLKHAGKVPMLAVYRTPWGEASFALRGKTTREKLVGVQNLDHPIWRLYTILDLVKRKRIYVYSGKKKMVCTGKIPHPPDDFIDWNIKQLPYNLTKSGRIHSCKHLKSNEVENNTVEGTANLRIYWKSADRIIAIGEYCAKKENTPFLLSRYMSGHKMIDDFEISVHYRPRCGIEDCSQCQEDWSLGPQDLRLYRKGQLSDLAIIQKGKKMFEDLITAEGKRIYLAAGVCYGDDLEAFIDSLKPDDVERTALETVLTSHDSSLIADSATPSKVLSLVWDDHGKQALQAITGDPDLAQELFSNFDSSKTTISSLLHEAERMIKIHAVLSSLPEYSSLPKDWEFADGVARSYRTGGKKEALEHIDKRKEDSMSLAWAFLLAFDATQGKEWMFNEIQREHGNSISEYASNLLNAESADYHEALSNLMKAMGSSVEVMPSR